MCVCVASDKARGNKRALGFSIALGSTQNANCAQNFGYIEVYIPFYTLEDPVSAASTRPLPKRANTHTCTHAYVYIYTSLRPPPSV